MTTSPENTVDLPAWLEAARQPDEAQAAAYEACPAEFRASLKTAIAFTFHLWGESAGETGIRLDNPHSGFTHLRFTRPASWVFALLSPEYASPARFIAAVLPAVLAGVTTIIIASPETSPAPALCAAFELAGLEDIFILSSGAHDAPALLRELHTLDADGRVLLFPSASRPPDPRFPAIRREAERLKLRLWQDAPAPRLSVLSRNGPAGERPRRDIIAWAHGDADILDCDGPGVAARFAECPDETLSRADRAPALSFGPGLESCWVHSLLEPSYFRTRVLHARFNV